MSTAAELAAALIASRAFAINPVAVITTAIGDAAQAQQTALRDGPALASKLTRVACLLVTAANNPAIGQGAILDALVAKYGQP